MEDQEENNPKTKITFELPFCLYKLDERFFSIGDQHNTKIRFTKQKIEPSRRTAHSENIEFLRDRWGIDGFSKVEMETDKEFAEITEAMDFTISSINNFIKLYRYFDEDAVHIFSIISDDLFNFSLRKGRHITAAIGFGGGLTQLNPTRVSDISSKIQTAFDRKIQIPLWQELLMNARYYSFIGEYKMTILETIIALEKHSKKTYSQGH